MDGQTPRSAKAEYERFKLQWMLDHGFTLENLVCELYQLRKESGLDARLSTIFANWECEYGFGSQIWPCFDEFLDCEYKTAENNMKNFKLEEGRQMDKCDSCKNKGTAWCRGCEHRQSGLEQFDFYQEKESKNPPENKNEEVM